MNRIAALALGLAVIVTGCGKNSTPTQPSQPQQTPTRIISLDGNLNFGNVNVGSTADRSLIVNNAGNAALTVSGITGPFADSFTVSTTTAVVPAGGSTTIVVHFTPLLAQTYSGTFTVKSDATSGDATHPFSGFGIRVAPLFSVSGTGNTVFDMPAYVQKLHVTGTYNGSSSNFIIWVGPAASACGVSIGSGCRLLVNEIIGTFNGHTPTYDAIVQTGGGGTVSITNSSGVAWTLTEVQ